LKLVIDQKEATKRELDLLQQLSEARAQLVDQAKEVCDLQVQVAEELKERQKFYKKVAEQEREILRLLESQVGSKARASDAGQKHDASKSAAASQSSLMAGRSNVANSVERLLPCNSNGNMFPKVCITIRSILPAQDVMFSPGITTCGAWQPKEQPPGNIFFSLKVSSVPSSPIAQRRDMPASNSAPASPGQQFNLTTVPPWALPGTGAMVRKAMADVGHVMPNLQVREASRPPNLQVREASRPLMHGTEAMIRKAMADVGQVMPNLQVREASRPLTPGTDAMIRKAMADVGQVMPNLQVWEASPPLMQSQGMPASFPVSWNQIAGA